MPRSTKTLDERLAAARKLTIDLARKKRIADSVERQRQKKLQGRRDFILGGIIRKNADSLLTRTIDAIVDEHVTNERERALFGLEKLDADPVADMETSPAVAAGKAKKKPVAVQKKRRTARKPRRNG